MIAAHAREVGEYGVHLFGIHPLQRALLSARFPWIAPFDNRRTQRPADFGDRPPQIDEQSVPPLANKALFRDETNAIQRMPKLAPSRQQD